MTKTTHIKIDSRKLKDVIKKTGESMAQISQELGYSKHYINDCISRGYIRKSASILLEIKYGIPPQEYEYTDIKEELGEQSTEDKTDGITISGITEEKLANLIYKAVYSAVIHAWQNDEPRSKVLGKE